MLGSQYTLVVVVHMLTLVLECCLRVWRFLVRV